MRIYVVSLMLIALALPAAGQGKWDFGKIQIKATRVAGQVYVIEDVTPDFSGGNIGASVGPDGVVLIDDKFAPLAPKIEAALRTISDQPIRFILNTHHHDDHTDGNAAFGHKSTIIAHENTRKRLIAGAGKDQVPPAALPVITFDDKLSVHLNGEDIRALHVPSGHTDNDVVIFFPKSNVVHMGDEFSNGIYPFIDTDAGGSVKGMIANLIRLLTEIPADAKIIPGHGKVGTVKDLRAFLAMLQGTTAIVEAGIKAGKTADQLKKAKALAAYEAWAKDHLKADDFIDILYKDLKR
jgi:cyclase